jgi:hypothetical protein
MRILAVGSHHPTTVHVVTIHLYCAVLHATDSGAPQQTNPEIPGSFHHGVMQNRATNSNADTTRKLRLYKIFPTQKANTTERRMFASFECNAQDAQGLQRIRHETLTASFVDGRLGYVGHGDVHSLLSCSDGCRESRWTTADDKNIRT